MIAAILKWIASAVPNVRPASKHADDEQLSATPIMASSSTAEPKTVDDRLALYFDEAYYTLSKAAAAAGLTPLQHYLTIGEALGAAPSARFNPRYYAEQYPDVANAGVGLLRHYVIYGEKEGRIPLAPTIDVNCPVDGLDSSRRTVLILVHDATRTGAPILAWNVIQKLRATYNVVAVLQKGGPLEAAFAEVCSAVVTLGLGPDGFGAESRTVVQALVREYNPLYAIANSLATRQLAVGLEEINVPVVALVHEFAADFTPIGTLNPLFAKASKIVFPAEIVALDAKRRYDYLRARDYTILRQGSCNLPVAVVENQSHPTALTDRKVFTVVGMGTITYRKGVDLFIATAAALVRDFGRRDFRFVWVGENIPQEWRYKIHMEEQVAKSGLSDNFVFLGEVADLTAAYESADVFYLTSRVDPLPNVAIDAMLKGIPIACFADTSGMGELLQGDSTTQGLVVPYLDVQAAARLLLELSDNSGKRESFGHAVEARGSALFDMDDYVGQIDALGIAAVKERARLPDDLAVIKDAGVFEPNLYFGQKAGQKDATGGLIEYLNSTRLARPLSHRDAGLFIRRPMPGFNPLIYGMDNPEVERSLIDPLAHFISAGKPKGRWSHDVIQPDAGPARRSSSRVALHGHFFYADLVEDFVKHLSANATPVDLYISTSGPAQEDEIRKVLASTPFQDAQVWSVPNRGRDIGPMLVDLPGRLTEEYDIVGHIHGKRSRHVSEDVADRWRNFAWQHTIGGLHPMLDRIAEAFERSSELGLIFPEDPHLNGWDKNLETAQDLARRMKLDHPLPVHFDFPIGTMFWFRPAALRPLIGLGWKWDDFPSEPIPIDGTVLHTLERMIPFAASKAGFTYATTYVAEYTR